MLRFIVQRLIVAIPTLFVVVTVAFFMMRAAPGSPFDTDRKLPPEIEKNIEAKYDFDKPLLRPVRRAMSAACCTAISARR